MPLRYALLWSAIVHAAWLASGVEYRHQAASAGLLVRVSRPIDLVEAHPERILSPQETINPGTAPPSRTALQSQAPSRRTDTENRPAPVHTSDAAGAIAVPQMLGAALPTQTGSAASSGDQGWASATVSLTPQSHLDGEGLRQLRWSLALQIRALRAYPEIARRHGQEGTVSLQFNYSRGLFQGVTMSQGSGHSLLDQQALAWGQQAALKTALPHALQNKTFVIDQKIGFGLLE
jgi:TonB family protein